MCVPKIENSQKTIEELAKSISNSLKDEKTISNIFFANILAQFINESPFICFIKDSDMKFVYVNRPMEIQRNMPSSEMIDKTATQLINHGEGVQLDNNGRQVIRDGRMEMFLESLPDGSGGRIRSLGIKFPFVMDGETYLGGISVPIESTLCEKCGIIQKDRSDAPTE